MQNPELFKRLENYFRAIDEDKTEDYHNKHKRKEERKIDEY